MNTEFDALEHQLSRLRPARLPAEARQCISHKMQHPSRRHRVASWLFGHRAGLEVALASVLSLAVVAGLRWFPQSPRDATEDHRTLVASNGLLPSLGFLEPGLSCPMGVNAVPALCSQSMLTNVQIRR